MLRRNHKRNKKQFRGVIVPKFGPVVIKDSKPDTKQVPKPSPPQVQKGPLELEKKFPINIVEPPKLSAIEDKLLTMLEQGKLEFITKEHFKIFDAIDERVNKDLPEEFKKERKGKPIHRDVLKKRDESDQKEINSLRDVIRSKGRQKIEKRKRQIKRLELLVSRCSSCK
jgi:hypothetical protein